MKPVAIFRHFKTEGPGYFSDFLDANDIPWVLVKIDENEAVPDSASLYSGLVFMGGPMSVNDDLPWIKPVLILINDAYSKDIPLLGHCLGGQLISKALGGHVGKNPVKEIGWGEVEAADNMDAKKWFGELKKFPAFHWHGETFEIPKGANLILSSPFCKNQAYSMGPHLALQCHVEMTGKMVKDWCEVGEKEIMENLGPSVESAQEIETDLPRKILELNGVAKRIYSAWIKNLRSK